MASLTSSPPNVELLFGPMLIGVTLNTMLYGVLLVQLLTYYNRYKRDRTWFRYLALYLMIAETANVSFDVGLIYEPLIARWASPKALQVSPIFLRPEAAVTVAISTPVQLFVAWRIMALTQTYIFPAIIAFLAMISLAGGLCVSIKVSLAPDYSSFDSFHPFVATWLSATAACDVVLSAALIYSLRVRKSGESSTDRYVDRIIRLTFQTGSITAVTALLDLFVFLFSPTTTLQFIWDFPLSKLYSNALLSTLNSRPWREENIHRTMNVLFEQTPTDVANGLSFNSGHATSSPPRLELALYHRPLSAFAAGRNPDLESGFDPAKSLPV